MNRSLSKYAVIFLLTVLVNNIVVSQEVYNNCNNALEICPNVSFPISNIDANVTFCPNCEDDFATCFTPNNSIWLSFTTNEFGGDVNINFSNVVIETAVGQDNDINATIFEAIVPCNSTSYTQVGSCVNNATGNFGMNAIGLNPNTVYYIVLSGDQNGVGVTDPAEFTADVVIFGSGIDRPVSSIGIGTPGSVCENAPVAIYATRFNCPDGGLFNWYINGNLAAVTTDSVFYTSNLADGDQVTVESTCYSICEEVVVQTSTPISVITVNVDAGEDIVIQEGQSVLLDGQTAATNYFWFPEFALSDTSILNPVANPNVTTTYGLSVTENGCTAIDYVTVTVETDLFFPNTFSPNNDGNNDKWIILGIHAYPDCLLTIYDRWGQQVFQATGYSPDKAWDGTGKNGGRLNEGVYFYEMQLRDSAKSIKKGSITLIR